MSYISTHGKWSDPRREAAMANDQARRLGAGWGSMTDAGMGPSPGPGPTMDDTVPWHPHHHGRPQPGWYGAEWMHNRSPAEHKRLQERFENFMPRMASSAGASRADAFFADILPPGANLAPGAGSGYRAATQHHDFRRMGSGGGGGNWGVGGGPMVFNQTQAPYQPEYATPDRQSYPVNRNLANIYFRLYYKLDYLFGSGIDMYSELPFGNCEFTGEGVDGEIKDMMERMWALCNIPHLLPFFQRERLVVGEAAPHCFYDKNLGIWNYVAMHNPDQLEVIYTPFIKMDPVVRFKPDDRLQKVLSSTSPMLQHIRESIPPELSAALLAGQSIELHPLNFTFLPRKLHPYDVRGTSIGSRLWRIFLYEDSIYNTSMAIARRAGAPLKIAKLGDRNTGWIPDPSHEARLMELLSQSESDPAAWICYNYGLEIELVGSQERTWKVEQSAEFIERVKLMALGLSKSFLWGEVSYASAQSGLTVFLQRLQGIRDDLTHSWIIPKFFKPIAIMNGWVKRSAAELAHGVRVKRSQQELLEDNSYIVPELQWTRKLDPSVESSQITAVQALSGLGVVFSKQYLASLVSCDWEEQLTQRARETQVEKDLVEQYPELAAAMAAAAGGEGGGGGGGGMLPGMPPSAMGFEDGGDLGGGGLGGDLGGGEMGGEMGAPPAPEAGLHADSDDFGGPGGGSTRGPGGWDQASVTELWELFHGQIPQDELWRPLTTRLQVVDAIRDQDMDAFWAVVEDHLADEGHPADSIRTLERIMKRAASTLPRRQAKKPRRTGRPSQFLGAEATLLERENDHRRRNTRVDDVRGWSPPRFPVQAGWESASRKPGSAHRLASGRR